ncbi:MAG TPA: hypothetical protein VK614_15150 [Allosphingosinicella sp.]|nr:hypothetical protein [Allosphingosinicella sp.]
MVKVKLGTVILPDDHSVYKLFPGKGYKFYEIQHATKLAFLDIRDLETLGDDPLKWTDKQLLSVISHDRVQRIIEGGGKAPGKIRVSTGDKQALTFLRGLTRAKKGDLIAVPGSGYRSEVLIGQITEHPGKLRSTRVKERTGTHTYFGRRVQWVATLQKRLFDLELINLLQSRAAFFDIGRSHYAEIHRIAFDSYVYDGQFVGVFKTSKSVFTPKDNLLTSVWFELMEVVAEASSDGTLLKLDNIYDVVIQSDLKEDERQDLSISIQSPGKFRLRGLVATPLVTMALFAMASSGVTYTQALGAEITAHAVADIDRQCMGEVDESVKDYLRILGKDRWEQACKVAMRARTQATLETQATVD